MIPTVLDNTLCLLYNTVMFLHKTPMTVTTEDGGRANMYATEPRMYISETDAESYGHENYAEKAEKLNGRTAMIGFAFALVSYATTGSVFFFGLFGF